MSEKFLITGGQGFIGAWIARELLDEETDVVLLDREANDGILEQVLDPDQLPRPLRVFADIADTAAVLGAVREHECTHIIHLAGLQVPTCRANPVLGARVNVIGTLNVFEAAREVGVKTVVYASSAAVAGDSSDYSARIEDDTPHQPRTHYGVFKAANEGNARVYFADNGISSIGLRPYTVYGVGREVGVTSAPTKAIKAALLERPYTIGFTGMTSFVFAQDLARTFIACARAEFEGARSFNIRGALETIENFIGLLDEIIPGAAGRIGSSGSAIPVAYDVNETGLRELLGDVPCVSVREGIEKTVRHFEALQDGGRLHDRDLD